MRETNTNLVFSPKESFISKIEQKSGVQFHEAQVAQARLWIGDQDTGDINDVTIKLSTAEKSNESEKVPVPAYQAAKQTLEKWESAARQLREGKDVSDSVAHHMLRDEISLKEERWLGTPEEELDAYVFFREADFSTMNLHAYTDMCPNFCTFIAN